MTPKDKAEFTSALLKLEMENADLQAAFKEWQQIPELPYPKVIESHLSEAVWAAATALHLLRKKGEG